MRRRSLLISAGLSSLAILAARPGAVRAGEVENADLLGPEGSEDTRLLSAADSQAKTGRVERLKNRILEIATANIDRQDNLAAVQHELEPLVDRLIASVPRQGEQERLRRSEGAWRGIWTNLDYGNFVPDLRRIFQVVTLRGHYWNLSQLPALAPGSGPAFNALRGAYASTPEAPTPGTLAIRFTRVGFGSGTLVGRTGAGLVELARIFHR
jgi:hypothetical protein